MDSVLLIYPAYSYPRKNPPMGLAYIGAYLEQKGVKVDILDFNINPLAMTQLEEIVKRKNVAFAGISFMTNQFGEAKRISTFIKALNKDLLVVAGGPHVSSIPEKTANEMEDIDVFCVGEGEETLYDLVIAIRDEQAIDNIKGIVFKKNGQTTSTPKRELIKDINKLPFPAWHLVDVTKYSVFSGGADLDVPTFALLSSRGCPSKCIFCDSHTVFSRRFRGRSAQNIFKEIEYLNDSYGMIQFDFVDDLITVKKKRVMELCGLLQNSNIDYTWMANARVNTVDKKMLNAMAEAGCVRIDFGVESGDPEVRKIINKKISNQMIIEAHRAAHEAGIVTSSFLMVGNIGESNDSVKMTVDLMKDLAMDTNIAIACPYPGTELYKIAKENKWIRIFDWEKYVTSPTYLPDYEPMMITDKMSQNEILEAYYFLHSFFVKKKFQSRYGKFFILNFHFWKEWLLKADAQGGYARKFSMAFGLVKARFKVIFS